MKRIAAWILVCILLTGFSPAMAINDDDVMERVSSYLTEVYSYTPEEAEKFSVTVEQAGLNEWMVSFSSADHPEWIYTAVCEEETTRLTHVVTPFYMMEQHANYPGEGSVREGLNRARKNGWFVIWEDHMRQELRQFIADWGITPTPKLAEGLANGNITSGNALHEYFVSCYGEPIKWTPELKGWHDAELEYYGFSLTEEVPVTEGIAVYTDQGYNGLEVEMTRFIGEVPEALKEVFSHPKLEGWTCLCGATAQNAENQFGYGLAVFEKEGRRLLTALKCDSETRKWRISPVSEHALYTDKPIYILPERSNAKNAFTIVYETSENETEKFEVSVGNVDNDRLDAFINRYSCMDEAAGNGILIEFANDIKTITYENHQKKNEEKGYAFFSTAMSMLDIHEFPTTAQSLKNAENTLIPEGYALVRGVHLRKKTSSRSKDLGQYNAGVLARVLGTEPGDPWAWVHVQIGQAEGYMASAYVDETATENTAYVLNRALPVAQAKKEIRLKKSMSSLSGTVQNVQQGTQMHVLAECDGGWLHVSIPQGEMQWRMDLNGTDGYVRKADVLLAGTPLALEWNK